MFLILIKEGVDIMSIKFSKALLMSGNDYKLTSSITLHHPTIKDILSINNSPSPDDMYWIYVQILLADPYANMVMLDDMGRNYLETTPYEVFILQWDNCVKNYNENKALYDNSHITPMDNIINAIRFFIVEDNNFIKGTYNDGSVCFYNPENPSCQINQDVFECMHEWVKAINRVDYTDRINPADENARRILIEDTRAEIKKKKRKNKKDKENFDYLGNLMSAASFCGNGAINPYNINGCKLYWINESLSINNKKSNADHILDGIYHGAISSKDINKKELDWIN